VERILQSGGANKQAQSTGAQIDKVDAENFRMDLEHIYEDAQALYEKHLSYGVPKELARLCLPVARYSRMRASANLRNWLAFLTLRLDPAAQWEIRQYAGAVEDLIEEHFPRTWGLFYKERIK
jgi:thymidylate synthase (FAD)